MSRRIYHYEVCLELLVLVRQEATLPSTRVLPSEQPRQMLYVPGTLSQVRLLHLKQPHLRRHYALYFPTEEALLQFFEAYKKTFQPVEAAGGVVQDASGNLLFIWKRNRWDLPKGKVEAAETPEESARREITEETGLKDLRSVRYLMETYHIYTDREIWMFKTVYWYLFTHSSIRPAVQVQAEEGIERYVWASPSEVPFLYPQSYGTIRQVIEKVLSDVLPAASG